MAGIADMLAGKSSENEGSGDPGEVDHKAEAEASVKAFFEAGEAGDYAEATKHLASAMEHCENYDEPDGDEPMGDEHDGGHGGVIIAIPHKK